MEGYEIALQIGIPVAAFVCLWLGIGTLLRFKPHLWDIAGDAAKSPPLVEEAMMSTPRRRVP